MPRDVGIDGYEWQQIGELFVIAVDVIIAMWIEMVSTMMGGCYGGGGGGGSCGRAGDRGSGVKQVWRFQLAMETPVEAMWWW